MKKFWRNLIIGATMMSAVTAVGVSLASGFSSSKEVEVEAASNMRIYVDAQLGFGGALKFWYTGAGSDKSPTGTIPKASIVTASGTLDRDIYYLETATSYSGLYIKNGNYGNEWGPITGSNNALYQPTDWNDKTAYGTYHMYKVHITDNGSTSDQYFVTEWNAYAAPAPKGKTGYAFTGWYSDSTYQTPFNGIAQGAGTGDINIYAKYEATSTVDLYVDAYDWPDLYVYTYEVVGNVKQEFNGTYPGTKVTITDTWLQFNGGMLMKVSVPYYNLANAKFIFNANTHDGQKSGDMTPVANAYYWYNGSAWASDSAHYASAAAYVYEFNVARLAVPSSEKVKQYSICGLNAKTWVDRYNNNLTSTAQGYVNSASIWTYKDKESTGADTRVTFAEILVTLNSRYALYNNANLFGGDDSSTSTITIVAVFILSAVGITTFFVFQKKKKLNIK